eukprot:gene49974-67877_t
MVVLSFLRPNAMPPLPADVREPLNWKLVSRVLWGMIPSIVLIFLVLGTIGMGLATPTEAGAMGAVGAMVLAALHKRLTWPLVEQAMTSTMRLTSMVVFILIGSTCFSLVFQGMDGARDHLRAEGHHRDEIRRQDRHRHVDGDPHGRGPQQAGGPEQQRPVQRHLG